LSQKALRIAEKYYSWDATAEKFEALLLDAANIKSLNGKIFGE